MSIDEIRSLVAERQRYDDWLTALEARRADTPVRVFERVHGDYVVRRDLVMAQLREHIGVLSAHGDELDGRHAALEAELATLEDERAEAMLRTAVGEYDDDRWATVREDVETKIAALGEQRDGLLLEIDEIHTLLSSARREPPAAVAEVVPAAIAPAAEVDIPLGVGAEGVADVRLVAAMPELADFDEEPLPVMETTQEFDDALALFSDEPAAPDTPVAGTSVSGSNTDLDVRGTGNTTLTATLDTGSGVLTKNGTGTLTLNGVGLSTYTGDTTINTGVVSLQTVGGLGATTAGTTVASGAALELSNATYGGNLVTSQEPLTLAGTGLGGTGALLNRSGTNTFSGLVTLNGVDTVAGATLITAVTGQALTLAGGTSATTQALTVGTTAENGNVVISGNAANGTSELSKNGSGSLTFSGPLTKTGNVNLNLGTLAFTGTAATVDQVHLLGGAGSTLAVGSGTVLNTDEFDSSPLSTLNIASGGTVISTYNVGNTVFSGQITGTGGTFKALGTGQVTFDRTIINPGLSVYLGGTSIGTNLTPLTFTLAGATTLQFGALYITGDTILDFGDSAASVLSSANLIINAGVKITVQNWISMTDAWYATSALVQNNNGTITSGTLNRTGSAPENQITFTGFSNNSTAWIDQTAYPTFNQYEIRPVPEPSTYGALLVSGCGALLAYRRFRRRRPGASPSDPA